MYRALYAYKSKLPKYLSFESGDKFTLIDTSVSDQWFLAQNGLGQIGYVPFNYIKKIEATTDQLVKFIDGSIEAVHLLAGEDGSHTQEQRLILKKLVKHRGDIIKRATLREKSPKGASKRRPAPAPPVEKSLSVDTAAATERGASLAVVGRSATISVSPTSQSVSKNESKTSEPSSAIGKQSQEDVKSGSKSLHRSSIATDGLASSDNNDKSEVRKSRSVTNSIGQAPSIVSSASSMSTDIDTDTLSEASADNKTNSETSSKGSVNMESSAKCPEVSVVEKNGQIINQTEELPRDSQVPQQPSPEVQDSLSSENGCANSQSQSGNQFSLPTCEESPTADSLSSTDFTDPLKDLKTIPVENTAQSVQSKGTDSPFVENGVDDDFPPPPPDLQIGVDEGDTYFYSDYSYALPPAPEDLAMGGDGEKGMEESSDSDSLDLLSAKALRECSCEDHYPTFDVDGHFPASGSLLLPSGRQMDLRGKEKRDIEAVHQFLTTSAPLTLGVGEEQCEKELEKFERLQAYVGVTVTHADCEEMIGQFQRVSNLSHEESHWALLSAMGLFAHNVPHLRRSMEMLGLRFKMAHQCPSTGQGYQSEDARTLEGLVCQLDAVMNDSQQRGHYLADDLDEIIDIITTLSETLNKAKRCVSVAAIQNDNYAMVEVIAKYYQMETRWLIHSCLLQLVEAICLLHPPAITEFLYSQLPLELVAEMQQHSNDDIRFLQVARTLGTVFMRGKASPHRLAMMMDLHFFIWLLGMIEGFNERSCHDDVEMLVALVCSYHLQHRDDPQNPVTEALKMAQGHTLLESALSFLSKHDDPTRLLNSGVVPKVNSVVLLLTHLYDSSDTSDLLYTNDVDALIGIIEEVFRDLSSGESLHRHVLKLLSNFLRCYPDTVSIKSNLATRLGPLLLNMKDGHGLARKILEHNRHIFEES